MRLSAVARKWLTIGESGASDPERTIAKCIAPVIIAIGRARRRQRGSGTKDVDEP